MIESWTILNDTSIKHCQDPLFIDFDQTIPTDMLMFKQSKVIFHKFVLIKATVRTFLA